MLESATFNAILTILLREIIIITNIHKQKDNIFTNKVSNVEDRCDEHYIYDNTYDDNSNNNKNRIISSIIIV